MSKISDFSLNIKISKIQRIFRIKKVKKLLGRFRELELSKHAGEMKFDEFSKLLRTRNVILDTRAITEYYSQIGYKNKLNGQRILTSFILKYFALDILGTEKNRHPQDTLN